MTAVLLLIAACVVALAFILRAVRRELRNAGMPHPGMPQREPWPDWCPPPTDRPCYCTQCMAAWGEWEHELEDDL